MHGVERVGRQLRHVEVLEDAERLQHGDRARAFRRHAADAQAAIRPADRLAHLGRVAGQVLQRQPAGVGGVRAHRVHDGLGDGPAVERLRAALRNRPQRGRQLRVLQQRAFVFRRAVGLEVVRRHRLLVAHPLGQEAERRVEPRRDREALLGQVDGGLEQRRPRQLAVRGVRHGHHADHAGRAHRQAAGHGVDEVERLAQLQELIGRGRRRRGFAAVVAHELLALAVVVHQERAAADARGLRLHQREHHLHGDGGVEGRAAAAQDGDAGLHRQRIGRRHHVAVGELRGLGRPARRELRLAQRLGAEVTGRVEQRGQHERENQRSDAHRRIIAAVDRRTPCRASAAQRQARRHPRGGAGRQPDRHDRHDAEQRDGGGVGQRIERVDVVQPRRHRSRCQGR